MRNFSRERGGIRRGHVGLLIAVCMFGVGTVAVLMVGSSSHHPDDSSLIKNFRAREAEFNRLAGMAVENPRVLTIQETFVSLSGVGGRSHTYLHRNKPWPSSEEELGFSQSRWDEYLNLFRDLDLAGGASRSGDFPGAVFFISSVKTSELDNDETAITKKGYVYSPQRINNGLTGTLDGIEINRPAVFFKHIEDEWYLFYAWSVGKPE